MGLANIELYEVTNFPDNPDDEDTDADWAEFAGRVTDTGGDDPSVTIYYGTSDPGEVPFGWNGGNPPLGVLGLGLFWVTATGTTPGITYFARAKATNASGDFWTDAITFTVPVPGPATPVAPAPDVPTIYDFEGAFETHAKTFIEAALSPTCTVNTTFSQDTVDTPRVDLRFEVGEAQPDTLVFTNVTGDGEEHVAYDANLICEVVTDNELDTQATHRALRSQLRDIFRRNGSNWATASLPYHEFRYIRPSGSVYMTEGNLQSTELSFNLTFNIRSNAFPVPVAAAYALLQEDGGLILLENGTDAVGIDE